MSESKKTAKPKAVKQSKKDISKLVVSTEEQNPVGRPSKYKPEYCQQLIEHMASGLSFETFAAVVNPRVNQDTLHEWVKVHEDFSEAKGQAYAANQIFWEKLGIDHIINKSDGMGDGISKSRSLNGQVWSLNMINRFKWRRQQKDEGTTVVVNTFEKLTDEQIDEQIQAKLKKMNGEK